MPHHYGSHGKKLGGRRKEKEKKRERVWARGTKVGDKEPRKQYDKRDLGGYSKTAAKKRQALGARLEGRSQVGGPARRVRFRDSPSPPPTVRRKRSAGRDTSTTRAKSPKKKSRSASPPRRTRPKPRASREEVERMLRETRAEPGYERRRARTPEETDAERAARHAKPRYPTPEPPKPKKGSPEPPRTSVLDFEVHKPLSKPGSLLEKGARIAGKAFGLLSPTPEPGASKRRRPESPGLTVRRRNLMAESEEMAKTPPVTLL